MKKFIFIFLSLFFSIKSISQEKKKIDIKNADFTFINNEIHPDYWRLIGNVNIFHNETDMFCDSAYYFSKKEKIIAFNNVKIIKGDSINLYGEKLNYDGEKNLAVISKNVIFKNKKSNLKSNELKFNIKDDKIFYDSRSRIIRENEDIQSNKGIYYVNEKKYQFLDSVIYKSNRYTLKTNNLIKNENNNLAKLIGPSYIYLDDKTIFCEEGYIYNNTAEFFKNPYIKTNNFKITADSLYYENILKKIQALGNVIMTDTINNMIINGKEADFFEKEEKMIFKKNPNLSLASDLDTLVISANVFENFKIEGNTFINAYSKVKFINDNLIGKCDSLCYNISDSIITLYEKPIMWYDQYQVSSDTIIINYFDKKINHLYLYSKPMMISIHDSLEYNQIKGKKMIGNFINNKLINIRVIGNGQSIYFLKEKDKTIGMNYLESSNINLVFKNKKINNINYEVIPHSLTTPIEDLKNEDRYLKGFSWRIDEKPLKNEIIHQ